MVKKVELFRQTFKAREDVVPRYWESNRTGKKGYSPLCRNEWKEGICHKPCHTCENADYIPLSDELILKHFKGEHILGIYPLLEDNTCNFVAADFDNHDGQRDPYKDIKEFYEVCKIQDIPDYVLRSKSGKGFHSYIFFKYPLPAWKARTVSFALLEEADVIGEDDDINSFDRLFPNQDEHSGKGFGNLIALPFQGKAAKDGNTLFLEPNNFQEPYENQWEVLQDIERTDENKLEELIKQWRLEKKDAPIDNYKLFSQNKGIERIMSCDFIRWCKEQPEKVPEPLWYALISNLVSVRPGGYSLCHELSRSYPKYSREETDFKIHQAMDRTLPHTCDYIKNNGFSCKRECGVKAPAGLIFSESD